MILSMESFMILKKKNNFKKKGPKKKQSTEKMLKIVYLPHMSTDSLSY